MQRPNFRGHELTPNTKPLIFKQSVEDANQSNPSSLDPIKQPFDQSIRNRNMSLNDLRPSPGRVEVRSSMMRQSNHSQSTDYGAKILNKLKERIDELQKQNKSLYELNIEFEQQRNLWQEKAKRLNQQLVNYEDKDLQTKGTNSQIQIKQTYQQRIKEYEKSQFALEQINKNNEKKIGLLTTELDKVRMESKRPRDTNKQIELAYQSLSQDYELIKQSLEREERKNRQYEEEILRLQEQLSFMTKEIPDKINLIQHEKNELSQRINSQKTNFERQIAETKNQLMYERQEKQRWQQQNIKIKRQITNLQESKLTAQKEIQHLNEQIIKIKQANYQQQAKYQEQILTNDKQYSDKMKQIRIQLSSLNSQNHFLKETIFHKKMDIQKLQEKIKTLTGQLTTCKSTQNELQKSAVNALAVKNIQSQNMVYKKEIESLNKIVQSLRTQINDLQASYIKQRNEAHQDIQHLERHIRDIEANHQKEKRELLKSVDLDITDLGNLVKEQQNQIAGIHQKYCLQIDKIIAENTSLKKNIQLIQAQFNQERAFLQGKLNQQKEYSFMSQSLKMQVQKLVLQLEQQKASSAHLMSNHIIAQEKYLLQHQKVNQLSFKIREYQNEIEHLHEQNEKWRSYRKSEEEDARKECRKYKRRVQELEQKQKQYNGLLVELQNFQKKCEQLKLQMIEQQKEYKRSLQEQKVKLNQAIDEMQTEMRKILRQYDSQKISRQQEIIQLKQRNSIQLLQIQQLSETYSQSKLLQEKNNKNQLQVQMENERLKKELAFAKNQIVRAQALVKKQETDNLSLKYSSDTQRDFIKTRYDKDMEQKVTEIQRLKLQVAHLSEELKANLISKKQTQALELLIKNKETQQREANQRCKYLQNMMETYLGEIRGLKAMRQKQFAEKRKLQDTVSSQQRKISQIQTELSCQSTRFNRINQQRQKQHQRDLKQAQDRIEQIQNENNRLQTNLYNANSKQKEMTRLVKEQEFKIAQLNKQAQVESIKNNRVFEDRLQQYQAQLIEWKDKYQRIIVQNNRVESKLNEAYLKEKNLDKLIRQKQLKINQLSEIVKKSKSQAQELRQKCNFLEQRLNTSTKDSTILTETKQKYLQLQQKQATFKNTIENQKQKIEVLCKDQSEKLREIQILLSKINILQAQLASKSSKQVLPIQIDTNKSKRVECYLSMCNLNLLGNNTCKLRYDGDQQLFLRVLVDTLKTFNQRLTQCLTQIGDKHKIILELNEQKENLSNKYMKYKAIAMEYKQKKQMQRYVLKNSYRFNEEIINHCQDIIKSDRK